MVLLSNKKVDVRSTRRFDLRFEGKSYGCICKSIDKLVGAVDYICKDKQYFTNMK